MNEIILTKVYKEYPNIYKLEGTYIIIMASPFGNCQSFCINQTEELLNLSHDNIKDLFKKLNFELAKKQFVIDILEFKEKDIIEKLNFMITNKQRMSYINSNGSHMVLYLIQFDPTKL